TFFPIVLRTSLDIELLQQRASHPKSRSKVTPNFSSTFFLRYTCIQNGIQYY
ncbi:unnamed protein product, partial [Ascophyllum nodosum]